MKTKLTAVWLVYLLSFTTVFAQEKEYVDEEGRKTTVEKASYYRIWQRNRHGQLEGTSKEYYPDGKLRRETNYENDRQQGADIFYHRNGKVRWQAHYQDNAKLGQWQEWFASGALKEKGSWARRPSAEANRGPVSVYHIDCYYDSTGKQWVKEGNGDYLDYHENGSLAVKGKFLTGYQQGRWEKYGADGRLAQTTLYQNGDLVWSATHESDGSMTYVKTEVMPEYKGGDQALMSYLGRHVRYPKAALKAGVEGTVYVGFIINAKGEVTEATLLKGIGKDCDAEAIRVIQQLPDWKAGQHEGQPVAVKYVLPIKYQLD